MFEWTFILFKCGKLIEAEKKAHSTFFCNSYLFNKFLNKPFLTPKKTTGTSLQFESLTNDLPYKKEEPTFAEFAIWASQILQETTFLDKANKFIEIEKQLAVEPVGPKRSELIKSLHKL